MASPNFWLRRVRRANRQSIRGSTDIDDRQEAYRAILEEVVSIAGEDVLDDLGRWMTETTRTTGRPPDPDAVRERAIERCDANGIDLADSPVLSER